MVDTGYIMSDSKLVLAGHAQSVEMELEEAAMYAGMLVKIGSTDNEVKINDAATLAYGWLGYEKSPIMYRPASLDTAYAINDRAAVLHGPGMILRAILANGTNVVAGNKLVGTAGGALKIWVPVEDTAGAGTTQENIAAVAMEAGVTTGDPIHLIVRSMI